MLVSESLELVEEEEEESYKLTNEEVESLCEEDAESELMKQLVCNKIRTSVPTQYSLPETPLALPLSLQEPQLGCWKVNHLITCVHAMDQLFEVPAPPQPTVSLDSINNTAAIWTGLKKYTWLKPATPKTLEDSQSTASVVDDASLEKVTKETKKRKKADTPSKKTKKITTDDNDATSTGVPSDAQSHKKAKTGATPKKKTPKKKATKEELDIQLLLEEIPTLFNEPEVIEQSMGAGLQVPEEFQDTPTKKRRTRTFEAAESDLDELQEPITFECPVDGCGKVFDRKGTLNRHMASHSEERNFKCDVCDKAFKLKGELVRHYKSHTSKQFECTHPGCGKKFSFECNLERHIMTVHMGVKNFECPECKKDFAQPTDLERHLLVHTGERPFACRWCDAKFKQQGHLQTHEKRKHDAAKQVQQDFLQGTAQEAPPSELEHFSSEYSESSASEKEVKKTKKKQPNKAKKPTIKDKPATQAKKPKKEKPTTEEQPLKEEKQEKEEKEQKGQKEQKEESQTPSRRSTRTAAKNVLYKFDFSDSD